MQRKKKGSSEEEGEVNGLKEKPCVGGERYRTFWGAYEKVCGMEEKILGREAPADVVLLLLCPFLVLQRRVIVL